MTGKTERMQVRNINGSKEKTRIMEASSAGGYGGGGGGRIMYTRKYPNKNGDSTEGKKDTQKREYMTKK
jgi:hypothetical protein